MRGNERFCQIYLRTMDPERAAEVVGKKNGFLALGEKEKQACLEEMRANVAGQIRREDVVRQMARLAFGEATDALKLALNPTNEHLGGLDLSAVAEFKVTEKGVEMKLVDRIRALEGLYNLLGSGDDGGAEELYRAIENAADQMEGRWDGG